MRASTVGWLISIAVPVALLSGFAFAEEPTEAERDDSMIPEKACFRVRETRSMSAVDDRFVYVRCIRDQHYLLTMENACLGLENSIGMTVANQFDRVCSNDRAWITYKEFNQTRRCGILNVEEVIDRDHALELVDKRRPGRVESDEKKETAEPESSGRR